MCGPASSRVDSEMMISPGLARPHRRAAMFTASPMTVYCKVRDEPIAPAMTEPVFTPMPMLTFSRP